MVFEPLFDVGRFFGSLVPTRLSRPHFNFITIHYMYLIGMTIIGSVILYPALNMNYTNAIFMAAGSATQSGLNTVNLNDILLYQQIVLMLIACVCNPIFINTFVVFVRLYWFEKRFEHLVREVNSQRRSRTRTVSKTKSQMKQDQDPSRIERGVAGRPITVLHATTRPNGMSTSAAKSAEAEREFEKLGLCDYSQIVSPTPLSGGNVSSDHGDGIKTCETPPSPHNCGKGLNDEPTLKEEQYNASSSGVGTSSATTFPFKVHREITFADEVPRQDSRDDEAGTIERLHPQSDTNRHILFLERQHRNAQNQTGTLRIPGPRDFDRGEVPKELDDFDDDELHRPETRNTLIDIEGQRRSSIDSKCEHLDKDYHPRRAITIDAPEHPDHRQRQIMDEDDAESPTFFNRLGRIATSLSHRRSHSRGINMSDARGSVARSFTGFTSSWSREKNDDPMPYLSWQATIGRNSAFLGLTEAQREELGGIEYRALKTLAKILIFYYIGFHLLGMVILVTWILHTQPWKGHVRSDGVNPVWWGFFTAASMFNDLGFTLTPDSMNSFQQAILPLLFGSYLIIIGNTGFPCMLRFTIWLTSKFVPYGTHLWEELRFLLDHPRRCFTLLFPSKATWWLFWVLVLLNGIDLIFFIILDLNDPVVTSIPPGYRVLDGWFQAVSTRTAGFSCVNIAALHPAIQVSYMIMMYISVFPIAISVRRTNVYEEKSLGIWGGEEVAEDGEQSYVGQHLRRQLSFDLWYVFLGFFIICIVEGGPLANPNKQSFSLFAVLFEIISAYGTVGLSLGYPGVDTSFSAQFHVLSKLVILAMMIRGRHRGLPYALDRAILLPSDGLNQKDEALTQISTRRGSILDNPPEDWHAGELDEYGLPKQHTWRGGEPDQLSTDYTNAGREVRPRGLQSPDGTRQLRRRGSAMTSASGAEAEGGGLERRRTVHERARSLGTVIAGGLSAGPTYSKYD